MARWLHREWFRAMGLSVPEAVDLLRRRLNRDRVPRARVALARGRAVSTASLIEDATPEGVDLPCLAGVYVVPSGRRLGVGSWLTRRVLDEAGRLGLFRVGLSTPDRQDDYARLGWSLPCSTEVSIGEHARPAIFVERKLS